ncbi:hypothetical protein [uncultured Pseudoteredinibacter sp.]|uniref:hypothetical protein n=1 Tax=uncultured Pseudoteredinibacter sp. TaxID=1641701 RepID=UPI0026305CDD|nr:hypothetical protein [uncultured Pseudoteredinibacter sp.]
MYRHLLLAILALTNPTIAATVNTHTNLADFESALNSIPHSSTLEDFSTVSTNYTMSNLDKGDLWRGFFARRVGTGGFGDSGYCPLLSDPVDSTPTRCLNYNPSSPDLPGISGSFDALNAASIVFTPLETNRVFGFHFDFVDWNDGGVRSELVVNLSDGTNLPVSGSANIGGAPAQFFGFTLDSTAISQGVYIENIEWKGVTSELVGFWNIGTRYKPSTTASIPIMPYWSYITSLILLIGIGLQALRLKV